MEHGEDLDEASETKSSPSLPLLLRQEQHIVTSLIDMVQEYRDKTCLGQRV